MVKHQLSLKQKISIFFSGNFALGSLIFFLVGMIFLIIFGSISDLHFYRYLLGKTAEIKGEVTGVYGTSASVNERPVKRYTFDYEVFGKEYSATSYSSKRSFATHQEVIVQYVENAPQHARILSTINAPFSWETILLVLIFPGIGLFGLVRAMRRTLKIINLLSDAVRVIGEKKAFTPTNTKINEQTLYKLEYAYKVGVHEHSCFHKTVDPHFFNEEEAVLYDTQEPEKAVLLRSLPKKVQGLVEGSSHDQLWE